MCRGVFRIYQLREWNCIYRENSGCGGAASSIKSLKGPFWPFSRSCMSTDRNMCDSCSFIREVGRFGTLLGTCAMAGTNSVDTMTHFANSSGACRQRCHARTICRTSHFTARATPKPLITRKRRRRSRGSTLYQFMRSILIFRWFTKLGHLRQIARKRYFAQKGGFQP